MTELEELRRELTRRRTAKQPLPTAEVLVRLAELEEPAAGLIYAREAAHLYDELELAQPLVSVQCLVGRLLLQLGHTDEAVQHAADTLSRCHAPELQVPVQIVLSQAWAAAGNAEEARSHAEAALASASGGRRVEALLQRAELASHAGHVADARAWTSEAAAEAARLEAQLQDRLGELQTRAVELDTRRRRHPWLGLMLIALGVALLIFVLRS